MKVSTRENLIQQIKNFGKPIFPKTVTQAVTDINDGSTLSDKLDDLQDQIDNIDGGGGGGSSSWGNINGTISDQVDLSQALNLKANASDLEDHESNTSNPHATTKAQVGLSNVDNTSDADKPVSTAQASAINAKYTKPEAGIPKTDLSIDVQGSLDNADSALQSYSETDPTVPSWAKEATKPSYTKSEVGLGNVDNTSDLNKPISTLTQSALDNKLDDPNGSDDELIAGDGSLIGTFQIQAGSGISITESNGIVTISLQQQ